MKINFSQIFCGDHLHISLTLMELSTQTEYWYLLLIYISPFPEAILMNFFSWKF